MSTITNEAFNYQSQSDMPAAESNGDGMEVHENGSTSDSGAIEDRNDESCEMDGAVSIFLSDFVHSLHLLFCCIDHFCLLLLIVVVRIRTTVFHRKRQI